MVDENEGFKAGLVIALIMLVSGFSMLFVPAFTGFGAVILSLGVMSMIVVLMTRSLVTEIRKWMDYSARIEETVSEILTFRSTIPPNQGFTTEQTNPKKRRKRSKKEQIVTS